MPDLQSILANSNAAPLDHEVFFADIDLLLFTQHEAVNLITGFANVDPDCGGGGTLIYSICKLIFKDEAGS